MNGFDEHPGLCARNTSAPVRAAVIVFYCAVTEIDSISLKSIRNRSFKAADVKVCGEREDMLALAG